MNKPLSTYDRLIFIKLLGIYLIANFSLPLMEGVHFLMHLGDDTELHSYQSHEEVHTHKNLNLLNQIINNQDSKDTSNKTESTVKSKKNIQYYEPIESDFYIEIIESNTEFIFLSYYQAPFLSSNAPPPKSKYSI